MDNETASHSIIHSHGFSCHCKWRYGYCFQAVMVFWATASSISDNSDV